MKKLLFITLALILFSCTIVNAQNSLIQKTKNKIKSATAKQNTEYREEDNGEGITSPLHEKYISKIVFSKEVVERTMPESKYDSVFTLDQPIYGRAYIKRGIGDYYVYDRDLQSRNFTSDGVSSTRTIAYIDEVLVPNYIWDRSELKPNDAGKYLTTFQVYFFVSSDNGGNNKAAVEILNKLSDGKHKVRLETYAGSSEYRTSKKPIAVGEFTIIKKGNVKLGRTFEKLQPGMKDPALEAKILKATQNHAKNQGWAESFTKIKIKSEQWITLRNQYTGVVTGRTIDAWGYATWPDGHCTYQEFSFQQDHDGSKFLDKIYFGGVGSQEDCDCSSK